MTDQPNHNIFHDKDYKYDPTDRVFFAHQPEAAEHIKSIEAEVEEGWQVTSLHVATDGHVKAYSVERMVLVDNMRGADDEGADLGN